VSTVAGKRWQMVGRMDGNRHGVGKCGDGDKIQHADRAHDEETRNHVT
jgi:hypothetical protein